MYDSQRKNVNFASALKLLYKADSYAGGSAHFPQTTLISRASTTLANLPDVPGKKLVANTNFGCNSGPRVCEGMHGRFFHNVAQCRCDTRTVPGHAPLAHASHVRGDKPGAASAAAWDTVEPAILVFDMAWDEAIILISSGR